MISDLYGCNASPSPLGAIPLFDSHEHLRRWVAYAIHEMAVQHETPVALKSLHIPVQRWLEHRAIIADANRVEQFVRTGFAVWHNKLYQRRPRLWVLGRG